MEGKTVFLLEMFSDYEPPEGIKAALSQAAIAAADIHLESRSVQVAAHSPSYIPRRILETAEREIEALYGLNRVEITVTHPETELHKMEPEELMALFVSRNSMTRGTLAGAKWEWEEEKLTIRLRANGKAAIQELIPQVQNILRERFAAPVSIQVEAGSELEGKQLLQAMDSLRQSAMEAIPTAQPKQEAATVKAAQESPTFYGKPFRGNTVAMNQMSMDMGTIIVEGRVFAIDHKELTKRNAYVVKFDMTDNTNALRFSRFL